MAPTDLLIDGYNLLHAAGLGRSRYGRGDLQRARQALLRRLFQLLTADEISHTAVVFDAKHPPPYLPALWYIHGMRVVYARPHGDADLILEQLIDEHSAPKRLTVVSSDHRLHRAAKSRRATAIDSSEFLDFLETRRTGQVEVEIPEPRLSTAETNVTSAELAYWMSVFGDVKVAELAAAERPARTSRVTEQAPQTESPSSKLSARTRKNKRSTVAREPETTNKPSPELFSAEWIDELQRWVDQQQA